MNQDDSFQEAEIAREYDFRSGERGRYARLYAEGSNVVVLSPDVAEAFPDSESVNEALRVLKNIADRSSSR